MKAVRCDRKLPDRTGPAKRIIDRGGDRGARRADAGLSGAFDAERVERRWCVPCGLRNFGKLAGCTKSIISPAADYCRNADYALYHLIHVSKYANYGCHPSVPVATTVHNLQIVATVPRDPNPKARTTAGEREP